MDPEDYYCNEDDPVIINGQFCISEEEVHQAIWDSIK